MLSRDCKPVAAVTDINHKILHFLWLVFRLRQPNEFNLNVSGEKVTEAK